MNMVRKILNFFLYIYVNCLHHFFIFVYIFEFCFKLIWRAIKHDYSRYNWVELKYNIDNLDKIRYSKYSSYEWKKLTNKNLPHAINHFKKNRHHPEHFENGVEDMQLIDVVEMVCDWKAAARRRYKKLNKKLYNKTAINYKIDGKLYKIISNIFEGDK